MSLMMMILFMQNSLLARMSKLLTKMRFLVTGREEAAALGNKFVEVLRCLSFWYNAIFRGPLILVIRQLEVLGMILMASQLIWVVT